MSSAAAPVAITAVKRTNRVSRGFPSLVSSYEIGRGSERPASKLASRRSHGARNIPVPTTIITSESENTEAPCADLPGPFCRSFPSRENDISLAGHLRQPERLVPMELSQLAYAYVYAHGC